MGAPAEEDPSTPTLSIDPWSLPREIPEVSMKKASWILLTVVGVAITLISLVSAVHAYRTRDDYGIGDSRVSRIAAGDASVATALRGIRGTSAA